MAFDRVHHSGRRRAAETADLLAPLTKSAATVSIHLARAPAAPLLAELAGEHVALVGHEPWLGELAAWLVTGSRSRGARFALKKGGVIVLDGAPRPGAMRVVAALPPKVLRSIARR